MSRRQRLAYHYKDFTMEQTQSIGSESLAYYATMPFKVEYAKAPSGCLCFRVAQADLVGKPGLPASKDTYWPFNEVHPMPYLYKEWIEIARVQQPRRRSRMA